MPFRSHPFTFLYSPCYYSSLGKARTWIVDLTDFSLDPFSLLVLLHRKEEGHPAKQSTKAPTLKKKEVLKNQMTETGFVSYYFRQGK